MPIDIEALLQPISADQPGGADVRYDPITDQIKEARRRDDDLNQGVWKRDVKTADYPAVLKLGTQCLTKRSKDLQIAAWMCEALLCREGMPGLLQGLQLVRRLLEDFWDTVYPQIDDGDLELRATPLRWIGSQLNQPVREAALTQSGHGWSQYRDSKNVPTEEEAGRDPAKAALREEAIKLGTVTPEEFEKGLQATSLAFSEKVYHELGEVIQFVGELSSLCDEKFQDEPPDFGPLKTALEEVHQTARILALKKGGLQSKPAAQADAGPAYYQVPVESPAQPAAPQPPAAAQEPVSAAAPPMTAPAMAAAPPPARGGGITPTDALDAIERFLAAVRFIRREYPFSPAPYLMVRGLRWGELRATGGALEPGLLDAPSSEVRVELKRLAGEGRWEQLRDRAEEAAGQPCGRAWLDVQRYAVLSCQNTGLENPANAILSGLKSLLSDIPQLAEWTLNDDTPCANPETMQWLQENALLPGQKSSARGSAMMAPVWVPQSGAELSEEGEAGQPDVFQNAMEAARSGDASQAVSLLSQEIANEHSGRGRFLRRIQLAQVCLVVGNDQIARPILQELCEEIDRRSLEDWEKPEVIVEPLGMLYSALLQDEYMEEERRRLYARICRLDPARALSLAR